MESYLAAHLTASAGAAAALAGDAAAHAVLREMAGIIVAALRRGGKVLLAGNGGSAADAQHLVAECVSRLTVDRPALRAIALTTDTSILTAIGNDFSYDNVFERQIEALGQNGDIFLGISTSGNSTNLVKALKLCKQLGITTVGYIGCGGGKMAPLCDIALVVPSDITMNIQEAHLALEHIYCMAVERFYFSGDVGNAGRVSCE